MKNLITTILLLMSLISFGQDEIKMPELDTTSKVYTLEFSPDPQNETVISAYMQGETEQDSLRFWAEGTITVQNVMVTVISEDANANIKVDIVKNHWEDSKISGYTKDGVFQESFDTANKFGIVLTSDTPETPFQLAVWTSGEVTPNMTNLFVPASNSVSGNAASGEAASNFPTTSNETNAGSSNILLYAVIVLLALIALFLAIMVIKKRSGKVSLVFLLLFLGETTLYAEARRSMSDTFADGLERLSEIAGRLNTLSDYAQVAEAIRTTNWGEVQRLLDPPTDENSTVQNPAGAPPLPSSCLPESYRNRGDENNGDDENPDNASGDSDRNNAQNSIESSNPFSTQKDDSGRPKYDKKGDPINYDESKYPKYDAKGDPIDYGDVDPDGDFDAKGRPKYDKEGKPIEYDESKYPKYDANGKPIEYGTDDTKGDYDDSGRPKYDKKGDPINYDESKYPKYDAKGDPIDYGEIDSNGEFDSKGRPKYDKEGKYIEYDESKYPKYDSKGDPIDYSEADKGAKAPTKKSDPSKGLSMTIESDSRKITEIRVAVGDKLVLNKKRTLYAEASMFGFISAAVAAPDSNEEGCICLEIAYAELNERRINLERLRIIFTNSMTKINAGVAFGDNVSGVHGVSGLAWQSQKMIILTESIPTLNRAYDSKYAEMMESLEQNLLEIDRCETMLGFENWYNHAGFIYFSFMADKYKRH